MIPFSASISSCARARRWREALQLLPTLELQEVVPNEATLGAVISACEGRTKRSWYGWYWEVEHDGDVLGYGM